MSKNIRISTPRNAVFQTGFGSIHFNWSDSFGQAASRGFAKAQRYIDSEVLRFCAARIPFQTDSSFSRTLIGSGEIYCTVSDASATRSYDANRGAYWFERGKAAEKERILKGARKVAGSS